jgi:NTE family protein
VSDSITRADTPYGYERPKDLQDRFVEAAERLRDLDGWENPAKAHQRELRADLVLEGCGVKAAGLVGAVMALAEAGYSFRAVAGTSAGAVVASMVAAISQAEHDMTELLTHSVTLDFTKFMTNGKVHQIFERAGGRAGDLLADAAILSDKTGIYSGQYLVDWLRPILHDDLGMKTFKDLKLTAEVDPDLSLAEGRGYRLVVFTSDITRGQVARLPWDYPLYGHDPDEEDPVAAVRASMSIPFIFEPVHFKANEATVEVPAPGGGTKSVHFAAGTQTWVDGALLEKFPIHAFDRVDGKPPRWPTIGVRLSQLRTEVPAMPECGSALEVAMHCLKTAMNDWDVNAVHERAGARTIFVDNGGISSTDFDLSKDRQDVLFINGVTAATDFVIAAAKAGGVPRN